MQQSDAALNTLWSWLQDPDNDVNGLLAESEDGRVVGLAHYRPFPRPLSATTGCFLDDLLVDPLVRGAADALLAELRRLATVNGWSVVRWITADDNYRGRPNMTNTPPAPPGSPTTSLLGESGRASSGREPPRHPLRAGSTCDARPYDIRPTRSWGGRI